jgi:glycerol kinase
MIRGIGITNQRETTVVWNRQSLQPYHNAIVWQCRRTSDICQNLIASGYEELYRRKTGLLLDPYFSGTKLKWLFDHVEGLRHDAKTGRVMSGTIDSYLVYRLTDGRSHVTDVSNASRTLLMDIETLQWDQELAAGLDVPLTTLPEIRGNAETFGVTRDVPGLPDGIPVCGIAGDQQAAMFGQACFGIGDGKCTYGTGAFLLMNTGQEPVFSQNRLLTTVAWKLESSTTYALEGSAFIAGAAVQWLRDGLQLFKTAPDIEALAREVEDTGGVTLVPAFVGLGAPYWRTDARGLITGLTLGTQRGHLARAVLEGIALQNVAILKAMETDSGYTLQQLKVDGGACANDLLMQMQADFLGCRIVRPQMVETTALGAACLAGIGSGFWSSTAEVADAWKEDRTFTPRMDDQLREAVMQRWQAAVDKA